MTPIFQAGNAQAVTPSDSTNITIGGSSISGLQNGAQIFVGTGGDISCLMAGNNTSVTFKNVPNGSFLPIFVKRVNATGTTATDIIALY
jgi:hypothetical protein